jgi:hypothetical protein
VRPLDCDYGYRVFRDGYRMDCYQGKWTRCFPDVSEGVQCGQ